MSDSPEFFQTRDIPTCSGEQAPKEMSAKAKEWK
jgi:hypothetical protein